VGALTIEYRETIHGKTKQKRWARGQRAAHDNRSD
jgi:hypothetical protein